MGMIGQRRHWRQCVVIASDQRERGNRVFLLSEADWPGVQDGKIASVALLPRNDREGEFLGNDDREDW